MASLLFLHIPKTAGTSLRVAFEKAFPPDERVYIYGEPPGVSEEEFRAWPPERRSPALAFGHFHFGLHEAIHGPARYITVVREPTARLASLYRMYRVTQPDWVGELNLVDWAFSDTVRAQSDNEMVRMISGRHGVRFGECPDDMLDEAIANLERHFEAVLTVEDLEDHLDVLEAAAGRPLPAIPRVNVGSDSGPVSDLERRQLEVLNRLDTRLYKWVKQRQR